MTNKDFYTVQSNDTLFGISRRTGVPVAELARLNGIRNPNRIEVGEKLALNKKAVCGVNLQFLDRDHNPLRDLSYVIRYCGKEVSGKTDHTGRAEPVITEWPTDQIVILVRRAEGDLKEIATVLSDYANKLVTLVSPKLKLEAMTHPHPNTTLADREKQSGRDTFPNLDADTTAQANKATPQSWWSDLMGHLGIKLQESTSSKNKPVAKVTNDGQEEPEIISVAKKNHADVKISEEDYQRAASELGCEVEVIMAIGRQETKRLHSTNKEDPPFYMNVIGSESLRIKDMICNTLTFRGKSMRKEPHGTN